MMIAGALCTNIHAMVETYMVGSWVERTSRLTPDERQAAGWAAHQCTWWFKSAPNHATNRSMYDRTAESVTAAPGSNHPDPRIAAPCYVQHASLLSPTASLLSINRENGLQDLDQEW